jgi:uncharacterized protein (TIGR02996 family)
MTGTGAQMSEDAGFLSAIHAAPKDRTVRLIYADWLDERGDSCGELVRIEEEMRRLPVFSDRFWLLKARRNELRSQAPPDWLRTMGYDGSECPPTFAHGVPDGWKERWRLIREFTERWSAVPLGDAGGRADEVRETEARLGRALPASVREWVAFGHDARRKPGGYFVLIHGYSMQELEGHQATSLLLENEWEYQWAIRHEDFALPDPPVYGFGLVFEGGSIFRPASHSPRFAPDKRGPIAADLTTFVLGSVMDDVGGHGGSRSLTSVDDPAGLIRDLKAAFPVQCRFGTMELFEAENVRVKLSPSDGRPGLRMVVALAKSSARETIPSHLLRSLGL